MIKSSFRAMLGGYIINVMIKPNYFLLPHHHHRYSLERLQLRALHISHGPL